MTSKSFGFPFCSFGSLFTKYSAYSAYFKHGRGGRKTQHGLPGSRHIEDFAVKDGVVHVLPSLPEDLRTESNCESTQRGRGRRHGHVLGTNVRAVSVPTRGLCGASLHVILVPAHAECRIDDLGRIDQVLAGLEEGCHTHHLLHA